MPSPDSDWIATWTGAAQGPYPLGNPTAQPDMRFALPSAGEGARDQTVRLIIRPHLWGRRTRLRLSNAHGTRPVTFAGTHLGLQASSALIVRGTNRPVRFAGADSVTVAPGAAVLSDPVDLPWVADPADPMLAHRALAVSFHLPDPTGPMTWHAKALTTSYLTPPGSGAHAATEAEDAYAFTTASWFFLDQVHMQVPGARTVVAIGDSITDGTCSTMNGDDRWPDFLRRRIGAAYGQRFSVVNQGIGGNRIVGPADYAAAPVAGGPGALDRLERDVVSLPNVAAVIWLEGINDFGHGGTSADAVAEGIRQGVRRLRQAIPGVRVAMGTLVPALNATNATHGTAEVEASRQACNAFIRRCGLFDAVIDFDTVTRDPATGELRAEFVPDSSIGGPGDKLHPNRVGYRAMAGAIDLGAVLGAVD